MQLSIVTILSTVLYTCYLVAEHQNKVLPLAELDPAWTSGAFA